MKAGQIILFILVGALALWSIFLFAPSLIFLFTVFRGTREQDLEPGRAYGSYYAPYADRLLEAQKWLHTLPFRRVEIRSEDGLTLAGEYLDRGFSRTVLYLPGFHASPFANFGLQARDFLERGWNLLLVHERGQGVSGGREITLGLRESGDAVLWARWLAARSQKTVVYGISMGGAAAAYASDRLPAASVKAVVDDCGFSSPYRILYRDCQKRHLPAALLMPLLTGMVRLKMGIDLKQKTEDALARTKIPVFFLHGEADTVVPPEFGRANCAACASPKEAVFVPGAPHTAAYPAGGEALKERLFAFLDRYTETEKENSDETL